MSENIEIQKKYNTVCIIAAILAVLLLICLFTLWQNGDGRDGGDGTTPPDAVVILDGKSAPIGPELKKFIAAGNYQNLFFQNDKAQIKVVNADSGKEAEVCRIDGTQVSADCNWDNRDIKFTSTIVLFELVGSPGCPAGQAGSHGIKC